MQKQTGFAYAAAIDPLALVFPDYIYVKIVEGLHPHVPSINVVERAVSGLTVEEKKEVLKRAKHLVEYAEAVEKVVAKTM
jgi:hypothetical protein